MADEINTLNARKLRQAMKHIGDKDDVPEGCVQGDHVEIRGTISGGPNDPDILTILRGGEKGDVVASIPITPGIMKRLKREMGWWKDIKSGSRTGFRFGNRP